MKILNLILLLITFSVAHGGFLGGLKSCQYGETCIPHNKCKDITDITADGNPSVSEKKYLNSKFCNYTNQLLYFCCKDNSKPTHLPEAPDCGFSFQDRIIHGEDTYIDEFPWFALIQYLKPVRNKNSRKINYKPVHKCGGSLINKRFVLTAAHCVTSIPNGLTLSKVRLGEWDLTSNPDIEVLENEEVTNDPYVDFGIEEVIVHPEYYSTNIDKFHDIALIKLQHDVQFTKWIMPICLPLDLEVRKKLYASEILQVAGYGITETGFSSDIKKVVEIDGLSQAKCQALYSRKNVTISKNQICAGTDDGRDSCKGDSGGPLMRYGRFPHSMRYYQHMLVGIVSYGPVNCGDKDLPGVYVRVSEYMDWIISKSRY